MGMCGAQLPTRYQKVRKEPLNYKEKLTIEKMSDGVILSGRAGGRLRRGRSTL